MLKCMPFVILFRQCMASWGILPLYMSAASRFMLTCDVMAVI